MASYSGKFGSGDLPYFIKNGMCFVTIERTPSGDVANRDVVCTGLPAPITGIYFSLQTTSGNYTAYLGRDGLLEIYYPTYTSQDRIDTCFCYIIK